MTSPTNAIFVVDDDAAVRNRLKFLLQAAGYEVQTFSSARCFLDGYEPDRGGCLLLDVQMPMMTGPELQRELNARGWRLPVIFITAHATVSSAIAAIKAGAFDLVEKPWREDILLKRVEHALHNNDIADQERLQRAQLEAHASTLTERELEVLALIAEGEPSKIIARRLNISPRTVDVHRSHIIEKLQARSPSDLIRMAVVVQLMERSY